MSEWYPTICVKDGVCLKNNKKDVVFGRQFGMPFEFDCHLMPPLGSITYGAQCFSCLSDNSTATVELCATKK